MPEPFAYSDPNSLDFSSDQATDAPRILKFDPNVERKPKRWRDEETLGQFIPLIYHYNMLQDEDRVGAFKQAIEILVRPGMRVLELGAGTGILSSFAARCGADVWAVERNPELVECAKRFVAANQLSNSIEVIAADASSWIPPKPVDVVICEMLHVGLLREKQAQVISAFKKNYVAKFGKQLPLFIPEASILMCQPVCQDFEFAGYLAPVPMFQPPLLNQPRTQELSALQSYQMIQYDQAIPIHFDSKMSFKASSSGEVNALRLVTQNILTVEIEQQRAITWPNQCLVLPMSSPLMVFAGDIIDLSTGYEAGQPIESLQFGLACQTQNRHSSAA